MTYSTRLALSSQQLQLLRVPELDEDVDGPLLVIFVLADADFARAADTWTTKM
jgi:hypothetical protein